MQVEMATMVMIENDNNEVLVQDRKLKYKGYAFPGGHVEKLESITDCAIREIKEETGLTISSLKLCGIVHWNHSLTDNRYLCFMYKTNEFSGKLIKESREGDHFWLNKKELFLIPKERFSTPIYALSKLFHNPNKYNEAYIIWNENNKEYEVTYK